MLDAIEVGAKLVSNLDRNTKVLVDRVILDARGRPLEVYGSVFASGRFLRANERIPAYLIFSESENPGAAGYTLSTTQELAGA